jgi:serine/threonine protein kinase
VSEGSRGGPGEFAPGSLVAGYRLEEQIGQGGMAVVFRAHDPRLDRYVALKIMAPGLALDDAFRQRFIRESRAAAAVDDPHIIPVFEAGEEGGVLFIAMRFVRGGDVRSLLDREGPLPPRRATEIISQVASALDSAHARGLVHRDVKPANMLLDASTDRDRPDHVYLSDFGLTKTALAATGLTSTGQFLGTLDYVAPEQIEGRPVDGRTDLYALACAAFELLTGAPPFRRDQGMAVMFAQVSESPPLLSSRRSDLPRAADAIMNRALAKSPGDRYASCRDFAAALRRVFGLGVPDSAPRPSPAARPPTQIAALSRQPPGGPAAGAAAARGTGAAREDGADQGTSGTPKDGADQGTSGTPKDGADQGAGGAPEVAAAAGSAPAESAGEWNQPPEPAPSGPPTEAAGYPVSRGTRPGLTEPSLSGGAGGLGASGSGAGESERWGDPAWFRPPTGGGTTPAPPTGGGTTQAGRARRPWWRSPVPVAAAAAAAVVVVGGGGYLLFGRGGGTSGGGAAANAIGAGVNTVGCSTSTPRLAARTGADSQNVKIGGTPFAVSQSRDGQYTFVTVHNGIAVLRNTGALVPTLLRVIHITGADKGLFVTHDDRYLLAAVGNGAVVIDVAQAEQGFTHPVRGALVSPSINARGNGAVGVRTSPDDAYAFVTMQNTTKMAVFSLGRALSQGFSKSDFKGFVPLNQQPVGITASPDGQWLYVTSFQRQATPQPSEGTLSVVNMGQAEASPAKSVVSTVNAGCSPARVVTSSDGTTVWVTARDSNAVLAFSAAMLRSNPSHALIAHVRVGAGPIGLTLAVGGKRLVIADSNQASRTGADGDLAVIDTSAALAGKPALLGFLPAAGEPRQVTLAAHGSTLLVTNQVTGQLQAVKVADLP